MENLQTQAKKNKTSLEKKLKDAEREAKKSSDEAHGWKRAFQEKEDELQQVQLEAEITLATANQIRHDADRDLVQGLQTVKQQQEQLAIKEAELKSLHESLEPLLDMIPEADEEATLPVLKRVKSAPSRLSKYISDMAQVIVKNILSTIRVHMPQLDLSIIKRRPRGCTDRDISKAGDEVQELATEYANSLGLID